jgi:hypothetical protein
MSFVPAAVRAWDFADRCVAYCTIERSQLSSL